MHCGAMAPPINLTPAGVGAEEEALVGAGAAKRQEPEVGDETDKWTPPDSERICGTQLSERGKRGTGQE